MSNKPRLDVEYGEEQSVASLTFYDQDHTLGNSLRYMLMKNKNTSFCGYTVPHPLEEKMKMRIQTTGENAIKVVDESLDNLSKVSEHIMEVFNKEINQFQK